MGISKAKGMIEADRLDGHRPPGLRHDRRRRAAGGAELGGPAGRRQPRAGELTVVVDHNKIQSDTWVRRVSDLGDLEAKFAAFGWAVARCDGHDLSAVAEAVCERSRRTHAPAS